jgi:hypothetical protein
VRFSPRSIFFGVVVVGLPFAVSVGWTLGTPLPGPPVAVSAPGGAGGIGAAPPTATTAATASVVDWTPRRPEPVAVESSLPGPSASTAPSDLAPSIIVPSGSPDPSGSLWPPVPTPTSVITTPLSPSATVPPGSADPNASSLGGRGWSGGLKLRDRG